MPYVRTVKIGWTLRPRRVARCHHSVAEGHLRNALSSAYGKLGFAEVAGGDEVFRHLVPARIIEPTTKRSRPATARRPSDAYAIAQFLWVPRRLRRRLEQLHAGDDLPLGPGG